MVLTAFDEIADRITGLMNVKAPEGLLDKLKMLPQISALTSAFPKNRERERRAVQGKLVWREKFNLNYFPILKCWPQDGGPFITLPLCAHARPKTGKRNIGMYRMQVYDGQTGMYWQRQKAAEHYREALRNAAAVAAGGLLTRRAALRSWLRAQVARSRFLTALAGTPQISLGKLKGSRMEVAVAIGNRSPIPRRPSLPLCPRCQAVEEL